jgi:hypothetical protein
MRTRNWFFPLAVSSVVSSLVIVACSSSPPPTSPTTASSTPSTTSTSTTTTSASSASSESTSNSAPVDDLSAFPAPPAKCVESWTVEPCAASGVSAPSSGASFAGGLLVLSSRDLPDACATKANPKGALALVLTQQAPDGDFEVSVDVESVDGTATTNAVLFLVDASGKNDAVAEAVLGGDATSFGAAVHTRDEIKAKSDGANAAAKRGPGTLTLVRKGKSIVVGAGVLDGKPITKTVPAGAGPYLVGLGLRSTVGKGKASVGIGGFSVKDKSGKLKADDFECPAAK